MFKYCKLTFGSFFIKCVFYKNILSFRKLNYFKTITFVIIHKNTLIMISKNILKSLSMAMLALTIFSCTKKSSDPEPNNSTNNSNTNVTFLKVGTVSRYHYTSLFDDDTLKTVVEEEIAKDTFLIRNYSPITTIIPRQYMVLSNNVLSLSTRLRDKNYYQVVCKFGQPVGTTWDVYRNGVFSYKATIDSLNARVVTEAGIYNDGVKVKIVSGSSISYQYYSPSAGILGLKNSSFNLKSHSTGSLSSNAPVKVPGITYGNFNFLKVGNYWKYSLSNVFSSSIDSIRLDILSKDSRNVFKVKVYIESTKSTVYQYWFEDNGYLMVYMDGETVLNADPIYVTPSKAKVGQGWSGYDGSTSYIYKIKSVSENASSTKYGTLPCLAIDVSSGFFSSQTNHWNVDKGQINATGLSSQDLVNSNARQNKESGTILPGFID